MDGVTNGGGAGTSGGLIATSEGAWLRHPVRAGITAGAVLLVAAFFVNVASVLYEHPAAPRWKPITWEASSTIGCLAALWVVVAAVRRTQQEPGHWARTLLLHLAAATAFSAIHCVTMWTIRRLVYTLEATPYGWHMPFGQVFYEYHKDLLTYVILAGLYWGVCRLAAGPVIAEQPLGPAAGMPAMFDIRDGAKLLRVPVSDILTAESAGNYVTISLRGGSQKLMRSTLAQAEGALSAHGFLRVHRSWVINPASVRQVEPTGAGDWRLTLENGAAVPMSRRYPQAVQAVKSGAGLRG
jgi:hypothetical protein